MRLTVAVAVAWFSIAAFSVASESEAAIKHYDLNIPRQSLDTALKEFAQQTGLQVARFSDTIDGSAIVGPIAGELSVDDALRSLLSPSGLTFRMVNERTIAVVTFADSPRNSETPVPASGPPPSPPKEFNSGKTPDPGTARRSWFERFRLAQNDQSSKKAAEQDTGSVTGDAASAAQRANALSEEDRVELGEMTVTGSHIRGVVPESSPLAIYDRVDIEAMGVATVDQFLRKLPQNFAIVDSSTFLATDQSNESRGSAVNLHGLGEGSTLVLLNGHRMPASGFFNSFADVSMIPLSAIERVEVLTDGASAIYGADAVAGVVNFVLRRNFDGAETSVRFGDTTEGGASERSASQLFGGSWGSGNGLLVYDFLDQDGLLTSERDFIPDQGGTLVILPDQRRNSVIVSGRQDFTERTGIVADLIYSDRDYEQEQIRFGQAVHSEGGTRQRGATLALEHSFTGSWRVSALGSYADNQEVGSDLDLGAGLAPFETERVSELSTFELLADGAVFSIAAGTARASLGASRRREKFESSAQGGTRQDLARDVSSAYAELFVPFVGPPNRVAWADRLELSLAVRWDDYEDVGSSTDPKIGLLWAPTANLKLRGTYGTSFRVAPITQLDDPAGSLFFFPMPDPNAPDGLTYTIFKSGANSTLQPERSKSITFGVDAEFPKGFTASMTYFDVSYDDRIAPPPIEGSIFDMYSQLDVLGPFIDFTPDPAEVASIFSDPRFFNGAGTGPETVEAIFDSRLQNLSLTKLSGVDASVHWQGGLETSRLHAFVAGSYLFNLKHTAASASATVDLVNTVYNPMDLRLRAGVGWSNGSWAASATVNYADDYESNVVTPVATVDSWTTADIQVSYRTAQDDGFLGGITVSLDAQNVTDEDPPFVGLTPGVYDLGYDATNASPRGRFLSLMLKKHW